MLGLKHKFYLGVTNFDWFQFHRTHHSLEVNFWKPSKATFKVLQPGELFLFKIKAPYNKVAGGGRFVSFVQYPLSEAWRLFGRSNGADSYTDLKQQMSLSLGAQQGFYNPTIGCILLENTVFFAQEDWIDCPNDFAPNIVSGKSYTPLENMNGQLLLEKYVETSRKYSGQNLVSSDILVPDPLNGSHRFGQEYLIRPRQGQGIFRSQVIQAYQGKCIITQEHTLPVLEAGHIRPYSQGGTHSISNGLLMRSDFHRLFDLGYLTITPDYNLLVSSAIKAHFANGIRYQTRHGTRINLPSQLEYYPCPERLAWHNENIFQG